MSASGEVVEVRVGKQVRRADGVMLEEVITSTQRGNEVVTTTSYRPVGRGQPKGKAADKAAEAKHLKALLGEEEEEEEEEEEDKVLQPPPRVQAVQRTGDNPTMDKMVVLKQLLEEQIISKAEFDMLKKQVIDEMMAGGGVVKNPSLVTGRKRAESPESVRKKAEADSRRYIQDYHKNVYADGKQGDVLTKNATMQMQPTGIDGVYYTGKAAEVVDSIEEKLPDRRDGPEHKFRVVKTTILKELLDTGVVRVTRTEMIYDGYSGKYLTMNKAQKMKPKLSFHSTEEYDWDKEFEMTTGTSTQEEDKVENWRADMSKSEEDEYNRVVKGAIKVNYETRNVNNTAGKGEIGWDGVVRYPGGKPVEPVKKEKKPLFGKKKAPPKDAPKDKWAGFEDAWEDDPEEVAKREQRGNKGKKPGYKDGERKGIFSTKKAHPNPSKDKNMGEDPASFKLEDPTLKNGEREYLRDDGSGAGGFQAGEQWGAAAKQHTGKHAAGGSHFVHQDMWK